MLLLLALSVSLGCVTLIGLLHYEYFLSKAILRAVSENLIFLWTQEFSKPWRRKGGLCVCTGRKSFLFHPDTCRIYECLPYVPIKFNLKRLLEKAILSNSNTHFHFFLRNVETIEVMSAGRTERTVIVVPVPGFLRIKNCIYLSCTT